MTIKKKLWIAIIAILIAVSLGSFYAFNQQGDKGDKEITLIIIDETTQKTIYDEKVKTNTGTLDELLNERTQVNAKIETSSLGKLLIGLMDLKQDMSNGPWWVYSSKNNKVCIEQGMCPAIDKITLSDQDEFTFAYTTNIGF